MKQHTKKKAAPKKRRARKKKAAAAAQPPEGKRPMGRPTKYTQKLADQICEQLALGNSMRTVSKTPGFPSMETMFRWLRQKPDFREQYEAAKQESADAMAEDMLDIADDGTNDWMERHREDGSVYTVLNGEAVQRSRLRVDTRKWLVSKHKPKKYGDKLELGGALKVEHAVDDETAKRIAGALGSFAKAMTPNHGNNG